jgi:hypothetical protein
MIGSSYAPTYDGVGAATNLEWEIAIDNIFATRCMCPRRKAKNAASVLRHSALVCGILQVLQLNPKLG